MTRLIAAIALSMVWHAASAADALDRVVSFHVGASSLATALIDFSAQSGVQVAAADAEVSQRFTGGVDGALPVHEALSRLLQGTGLEFARVGAETVAIRDAAVSTANVQIHADSPRPPTDQELAGNSVYQFIVHHGTTPYPSGVGVAGSLTRWRGGRPETICPLTTGLTPAQNDFVTARLRAVATEVGAPVQMDNDCKDNVRIVFTAEPGKLMEAVYKWGSSSFGMKYPNQPKKLLQQSNDRPIQAWYVTVNGGGRVLAADEGLLGPQALLPLWPLVIQTGLQGNGCCYSGLVHAVIVANTAAVSGHPIGAIADYMAMIALSLIQAPDHCDPLPSILDMFSSGCGSRENPTGMTAGDLAFLKALYYHNTGLGPSLSRDDIRLNMLSQFKAHQSP